MGREVKNVPRDSREVREKAKSGELRNGGKPHETEKKTAREAAT